MFSQTEKLLQRLSRDEIESRVEASGLDQVNDLFVSDICIIDNDPFQSAF